MKVTINNKKLDVPKLGFAEMTYMEEVAEVSIAEALSKRQIMILTASFVALVTETDKTEATRLVEQHILGGGNIIDISNAFMSAMGESDFFKKMLGLDKMDKKAKPSKEALEATPETEDKEQGSDKK